VSFFLRLFFSVAVVAAFTSIPANATQPGQTVHPNGLTSGEPYNLNILGKKDGFACEQQYGDQGNLCTATSSSCLAIVSCFNNKDFFKNDSIERAGWIGGCPDEC
jgi:hypothetical protein